MKKILVLLFSSLLLLGACSNSNDSSNKNNSDKKSENQSNKKSKNPNNDKDKSKDTNKKKDKVKTQNANTQNNREQQTNTQDQQQSQQNNQQKYNDEFSEKKPVSTNEDWTSEEKQRTQQSSQGDGYDPNNPYMNLPNQEWRKNTGGLSSGEIQTRNEILNGSYQGNDAQQKLDAINYYEKKYSN